MRPYVVGEDLTDITVGENDLVGEGGMIAINATEVCKDWYIPKAFFDSNYQESPRRQKRLSKHKHRKG